MKRMAGLGRSKLYAKDYVVMELSSGLGSEGLAGIGPEATVYQ